LLACELTSRGACAAHRFACSRRLQRAWAESRLQWGDGLLDPFELLEKALSVAVGTRLGEEAAFEFGKALELRGNQAGHAAAVGAAGIGELGEPFRVLAERA
jgi:hypothetical protein